MITNLVINNFKSHRHSEVGLRNLTVLAGRNGMGKSSIIQSLLLLRQSYLSQKEFQGLLLNGDLVLIGNYQDAFCESGDREQIQFVISSESETFDWVFNRNIDKNFLPLSTKPDISGDKLNLFGLGFQYIAAEHLAAKESHSRNTYYVEQLNQISEKLGDGKFTIHYLSHHSKQNIHFEELAHPKEKDLNIKRQVEAWLSDISPSIRVKIKDEATENNISLKYQFETNLGQTKEYKPENVGFGISYVLPIIVAILTAKKGSLLIFENPESHLHPAGQAAISHLIALAAECGVQIIIETHSDHIINGILVSINQHHKGIIKGITKENVKVHFIDRKKDEHISDVMEVIIKEDGRIEYAPPGFFDQFSKDVKTILGF